MKQASTQAAKRRERERGLFARLDGLSDASGRCVGSVSQSERQARSSQAAAAEWWGKCGLDGVLVSHEVRGSCGSCTGLLEEENGRRGITCYI